MANWEQLAQDSTDEEEEIQRQKAAMKVAVTWETPIKTCWRQSSEGRETRFRTCWLRYENLNS